MKRILALFLSILMVVGLSLSGLAEQAAPQGGPGGMPPEKTGQLPQGGPGGAPSDGMQEPPQGGPGGSPDSRQSQVEGQLGSWSMGGTDADSIDGDDYAYAAALYMTAEGLDAAKSATERISAGSYDARSASGIAIDDSESGHNGILIVNAD